MDTTLGERLAQARREKGVREWRDVSRLEVAEAAKVDPSMMSLYEGDKSIPREDVLARIAKYLGVTPAYLRYGVAEIPVEAFTPKESTAQKAAKKSAKKRA